jgi:hypothetical protein
MHPDDHNVRWRERHKLTAAEWGVASRQTTVRSIALGGCSDQLDRVNLAMVEHLLREAQMIEHHTHQLEKDAETRPVATRRWAACSATGWTFSLACRMELTTP